MKLWGKTKSMLWIGSTGKPCCYRGFIFLIIPFSFLYFTELEKYSAKMMESNDYNKYRSRRYLIIHANNFIIIFLLKITLFMNRFII